MELKEVLDKVPGLRKRFVHYLESHGYIEPSKIPKLRIARRDYSAGDLALIAKMWHYSQQGYSVQAAYEIVAKRERCIAYVTFPIDAPKWAQALELLRARDDVIEASAVYGDQVDFVVKTDTANEAEIYEGMMPLLGRLGSFGAPRVLRINGQVGTPGELARKGSSRAEMRAYILVKVPGKGIDRVIEELRNFPEIVEASTVYGEEDIVLKVATTDQETLDDLVMNRLHAVSGVESTRTFIAISRLHWSRDENPG